jgi:CBS domain-containing protein
VLSEANLNILNDSYPTIGEVAHMGVITINSSASIAEAIDLMLQENLLDVIFEVAGEHRVFAVDDLLRYLGVSHDYSTTLIELPQHCLKKVAYKESIINVIPLLDNGKNRHLGVVDEEQVLVGVVSYSDVLRSLDPAFFVKQKKIREVIRSTHGIIVSPCTHTRDILHYLSNVENAVVVLVDQKPLGILTTKDALRIARDGKGLDLPISMHMTSPVETILENLSISQVLEYMQNTGFKRAVVVDNEGYYVGIVTQSEMSNYTFEYWMRLVKGKTDALTEMTQSLALKARHYEIRCVYRHAYKYRK